VEEVRIDPEAEWAVRGDRGLTTAAEPPTDARIVAGEWWPADYSGPPLVSLDVDIAKGLGLALGDTVTINVLGRDITASVASLRRIDWSSLGMNFTFVLSPGTLAGAPYSFIATVHAPAQAEEAIEKAVTQRMPNVSAIRVKEALDSVRAMLATAGIAVRIAAAVTLGAGALVLAGAIAAGHRRRVYEAIVLKVLGATRLTLTRAFLIEYGLLGAATGLIAGLIGGGIAWAVLVLVMHADWVVLPGVAGGTVAACVAVTLAVGFAGTWRALGAKVAPILRND
ncbi:MAG: ABC transporter permease, partial [Rhodospirillales bacterium]|nr:ABC transporter permease [Rhodospirillales bacterium]